jgi:Tol biopolymer transport system component
MVYADPGYVLYVNEGTLLAQAFDVIKLQLTGEPTRIAEGVDYYRSNGNSAFSVSDAGVLAYHGGAGPRYLTWFDRSGRKLGTVGTPRHFGSLRISPDGARAAAEVVDPRLGTSDIWIYDLTRSGASRLTTDLNDENFPVWSANSGRILFGSDRGTKKDASSDFYVKNASGMGNEELIFDQLGAQFSEDWSNDERLVAYREDSRKTRNDIWILPLAGGGKAWPFANTRFEECCARFSPDSTHVAFVSDESGTMEVYLASLQGSGPRALVSGGGGIAVRWRRDGKELFYLAGDGRTVVAVPVRLRPTLQAGTPIRLFTLGLETGFRHKARNPAFDVTPDGTRSRFRRRSLPRHASPSSSTGKQCSAPAKDHDIRPVVRSWTAALTR